MDNSKTIAALLEAYYLKHPEFGEQGGENERWVWIDIGIGKFPIPNLKGRQELVYLHDIHHILNDYNTNWSGEAAVSAWEITTGMGKNPVGWFYAFLGLLVGGFLRPLAAYRGFKRGLKTKSVIGLQLPKEKLLSLSLNELRTLTKHNTIHDLTIDN